MGTFLKILHLTLILLAATTWSVSAHSRKIRGTVLRDGKPAPGVHVTVDGSGYYTSFDGKYEVKAGKKSEWITFTFNNQKVKRKLDPNGEDILNINLSDLNPDNGTSKKELPVH
jgi:hypothetical protein